MYTVVVYTFKCITWKTKVKVSEFETSLVYIGVAPGQSELHSETLFQSSNKIRNFSHIQEFKNTNATTKKKGEKRNLNSSF